MSFSDQPACPQDFKIWPMAYIPFSIFPPSSNRNLPKAVKMPCLAKRFSMLRMTYQRHSLEDEGFFPTEMGRNGGENSSILQVNIRLETNSSHLPGCAIPKGKRSSSNHPFAGAMLVSWMLCHPWHNINIGDSWH